MSSPNSPAVGQSPDTSAGGDPNSQWRFYGFATGLVFVGLIGVLVLKRICNVYARRRALRVDSMNLQPVGDRGLLVDGSIVANQRVGFSKDNLGLLGLCYNLDGSGWGDEEQKGERKECIVCLGEYKNGEAMRRLHACGHAFHQECVDAWLLTHRSCPLCRSTLSVYESNSKEEHPHATPPAPDGVSISIPEGASTSVPQGVTISVPAATDPEVPEEEHSPEASPGLRHCQGSSAATGAGEGEGEAPTDGMNSVAGMRAVDTVPLQELPASESSTRTEDVVVEVSAVSSDSPTDASSHAVNVGHAVGTGRERENTTSV